MSECRKQINIPAELIALLTSSADLPSLPAVVVRIIEASRDPEISLADIAEILRVDTALTAKLLKIANSPIYARPQSVSTLRDALSLLGLNASITIALSFSLVSSLSSNTSQSYNYDDYWRRSILSATIARQIGITLGKNNLEELFLASLLQDIGILAIDSVHLDDALEDCDKNHFSRIRCEKNRWGVDHSDIGAWLLKSWNFPEKLYNAVLCSHIRYTRPTPNSEDEVFRQCVWISGVLSEIWLDVDRERIIAQHIDAIDDLLGLNREKFNTFLNTVDSLLPEMARLFEMTIINETKREEVLNNARTILMEQNLQLIQKHNEHQTQLKSLIEKTQHIEEEANRDHLTHSYNRKHIEELLELEFVYSSDRQRPLTLAFIDIDNFKPINDTYGHQAGDKVLQDIAYFFSRQIRKHDILARYGGDEFLLMLPNTKSIEAEVLLNRIIAVLEKMPGTLFNENYLKVSLSIGTATYSQSSEINSPENLISCADKALYLSKQSGKNQISRYN